MANPSPLPCNGWGLPGRGTGNNHQLPRYQVGARSIRVSADRPCRELARIENLRRRGRIR